MNLLLAALLLSNTVFASPKPVVDPKLGKITALCKSPGAKKHVWIFKQWHAGSSSDTRNLSRPLPQSENQTSLYKQLERWVKEGSLKSMVLEGCYGKVEERPDLTFNGWSLEDLKTRVDDPAYAEIVSSVPLKLKAKFGAKLDAVCGDDHELLHENALAFSDARGSSGFLARILENKDQPEKLKIYLDGVIETYHLPKSTTREQALTRLKTELTEDVDRIRTSIEKRNEHFAATIHTLRANDVAIVVGGIHADGLRRILEHSKVDCSVVEPVGYQEDEAKLLGRLDELVKTLSP